MECVMVTTRESNLLNSQAREAPVVTLVMIPVIIIMLADTQVVMDPQVVAVDPHMVMNLKVMNLTVMNLLVVEAGRTVITSHGLVTSGLE
jgi:hypothetical protein